MKNIVNKYKIGELVHTITSFHLQTCSQIGIVIKLNDSATHEDGKSFGKFNLVYLIIDRYFAHYTDREIIPIDKFDPNYHL